MTSMRSVFVFFVVLFLFSFNVCAQERGFLGDLFGGIFGGGDAGECPVSAKEYQSLLKTVDKLKARIAELEKSCGNDTAVTGACCTTEEGKNKCLDAKGKNECKSVGGKFYQDRLCSNLTTSECSQANPTGSCCHPKISYVNESGVFPVRCLNDLTEYKCKLLQGTWGENLQCDVLGQSCAPFGACCYTENGQPKCGNGILEDACNNLSGTFSSEKQCSEVQCQATTGSCCHPKISYVNESGAFPVQCLDDLTEYKCKLLQGSWGQSLQCSALGESCPPFGACCYNDDNQYKCANWMLEDDCNKLVGTFTADKQCSEVQCQAPPKPTGSCCHPKISYVNESGVFPVQCLNDLTEYKCKLLQGTWSQGSECASISQSCAPFGACCYTENGQKKCANSMLQENCDKLSGVFTADKQCDQIQCLNPTAQYVPEPSGACCIRRGGKVECRDKMNEAECTESGGEFNPERECAQIDCQPEETPETEGACCIRYGNEAECTWTSEEECRKLGGEFSFGKECGQIRCIGNTVTTLKLDPRIHDLITTTTLGRFINPALLR